MFPRAVKEAATPPTDTASESSTGDEKIASVTPLRRVNTTSGEARSRSTAEIEQKGLQRLLEMVGDSEIREHVRARLGVEGKIDRNSAARLRTLLASTPGLESTQSFRDTKKQLRDWDDGAIVDMILKNEDKWKTKPGFFAALYDEAVARNLVSIF